MTKYSVQPIQDFCLLLKIWAKNIDKNISRNLSSKYDQKLLDHVKKSAKVLQKESFKKQQKQLAI